MPPTAMDSPSGVIEYETSSAVEIPEELATPQAEPQPAPQKSQKAQERQEVYDGFSPENLRWGNLSWVVISFITMVHVGALAAPFFFSWSGLIAAVVLHWLTCSIGVCMAYHRCLSHKSLKLRQPAKFLATYFGVILAALHKRTPSIIEA